MLTMYQQITIKTLKKQGKSNIDIAHELDCHRNTVSNILARPTIIEKQKRDKPSYFDSFRETIKSYLDKGISRLRIFEILTSEHKISHTYDSLCKYIQENSNELGLKKTSYVVQQSQAGEEAEVDFGYLGLIPNEEGKLCKTYVFIMKLCFSRESCYRITYDQSVSSFINAFIQSFNYFGGVPPRIKVDNLKAAILKNRRYDLEFNKDFFEFSNHYNFVVSPCTPYEPQQKGKVEKEVGYVKGNFLPGRTFTDRHDLEKQLFDWMTTYANKRVHGTTRQVPHEVFLTSEKNCLQPLPQTPFAFYQTAQRRVAANCHINLNNCYYSVPAKYVGQEVEARWQENIIRVYANYEEIAVHKLENTPGTFVTNFSHFPDFKVYSFTTYQAKYEEKMRNIGENAHLLFKTVVKRDPKGWNRTIRKILGTAEKFGHEKTDKAIKRALYFNALSAVTVENICKDNLENEEIEPRLKLIQLTQSHEEFREEFKTKDFKTEKTERGTEEVEKEKKNICEDMERNLNYYLPIFQF